MSSSIWISELASQSWLLMIRSMSGERITFLFLVEPDQSLFRRALEVLRHLGGSHAQRVGDFPGGKRLLLQKHHDLADGELVGDQFLKERIQLVAGEEFL